MKASALSPVLKNDWTPPRKLFVYASSAVVLLAKSPHLLPEISPPTSPAGMMPSALRSAGISVRRVKFSPPGAHSAQKFMSWTALPWLDAGTIGSWSAPGA